MRLGRHPDADIQLDAEADIEVSAWHATISRVGQRWLLRDLGSRNGTYLNARRIDAETELHDGDRIRLGPAGPELDFRVGTAGATPGSTSTPATASAPVPLNPTESPSQRIRVQVHRQTRWLRLLVVALVALLVAAVALFTFLSRRQQRAWQREQAALQQRIDSILVASDTTVRQLQGQVGGLADALRRSRSEVSDLSAQLQKAAARPSPSADVRALQQRLQSVSAALARQQLAASLDFDAIRKADERAVAVIYVEFASGQVASGTAFAIRENGTFVTNRHVVAGPAGDETPSRIAIQFSASRQVWPARVVAIDQVADLALVKVDNIVGSVPVVRGLDAHPDTLAPGSPVALLGYPLGGDGGQPGRADIPAPLLTAGVISTQAPGHLEVLGYGAAGASGSPILDRDGHVIGVLYGGRHEDAEQVLLGVPSSLVLQLLDNTR